MVIAVSERGFHLHRYGGASWQVQVVSIKYWWLNFDLTTDRVVLVLLHANRHMVSVISQGRVTILPSSPSTSVGGSTLNWQQISAIENIHSFSEAELATSMIMVVTHLNIDGDTSCWILLWDQLQRKKLDRIALFSTFTMTLVFLLTLIYDPKRIQGHWSISILNMWNVLLNNQQRKRKARSPFLFSAPLYDWMEKQDGTSRRESSPADLILNFVLKVRMLRFSRHSRLKCRKSSFLEQKHS